MKRISGYPSGEKQVNTILKTDLPDACSLISAAPLSGSLAASFGGGDKITSFAALARGFTGLNMDSGMIGKFVPIILAFAQGRRRRRGEKPARGSAQAG